MNPNNLTPQEHQHYTKHHTQAIIQLTKDLQNNPNTTKQHKQINLECIQRHTQHLINLYNNPPKQK